MLKAGSLAGGWGDRATMRVRFDGSDLRSDSIPVFAAGLACVEYTRNPKPFSGFRFGSLRT